MEISWSEPVEHPVKDNPNKTFPVETAVLEGHEDRFHLWNSGGGMLPTMWTLWDTTTETQWFLYGKDWPEARAKAVERIGEILADE